MRKLGFGVVTALIGATVLADQASPPQRFEVVSVKPRGPAANAGLGGRGGGGGFTSCSGGAYLSILSAFLEDLRG